MPTPVARGYGCGNDLDGTDSHYDAIVVGSGFGGSVTAYRLAEAGKRVLRPRARPRVPARLVHAQPVQGPRELLGPEPRPARDVPLLVASRGSTRWCRPGLGGGSLIYANVFLRKDERWFVHEDVNDGGYEYWPVTRADLDPHYDRVEKMIGLQRYPFEHEPYAGTPKTIAFKLAAERNGLDWSLPPLAVTFANEGRPPVPGEQIEEEIPNLHGRDRVTCQLCGECDVGCNFGAKNTLDYNYLTHAKHHGAEIRTLCRRAPRSSRARAAATRVGYARRSARIRRATAGRRCASSPATTWSSAPARSARRTCCCATAARSRGISRKLGTRFCGNGDLLTLAINCGEVTDGKRRPADRRPRLRPGDHEHGARCPTRSTAAARAAASTCRTPATRSTWRGSCTSLAAPQTLWHWRSHGYYLVKNWLRGSPDTDVTGHIADLLESAELSAGGLPLLGMGRDVPDGRMYLRNGRLRPRLDARRSPTRTSSGCATTSRDVAHALGGKFADNPIWFLKRVITVHPLGGAPMGRHVRRGRRRPLRQRVRLSRPAHRRRLGDARARSARTRASRSPRWPTASPTGSSSPTPAAEAAAT